MCLATVLKETRINLGLSQTEFGQLVGYSKSSISDMERKKERIPDFVVDKVVKKSKSWRLGVEKCQECKTNIFCAPYLDTANKNPFAVLVKLKEELNEAMEAVDELLTMGIINKRSREDLTDKEFEIMTELLEQVYDVNPASQFAILRFAEKYELDPVRTKSKNIFKLKKNGALKRNNSPATTDELRYSNAY
ncbi:helix-turn-helix domain-containing protein [Orenia marismortui]|uniref:Helix-turn-helix protein n=1 Tax=Orenia marismortui TaxID=46469 RepID=A0A4R8GVT1_9FIRM|nr:helix-turn-helix transcriptional regulator [Orenia marismortui]TDX49131.1 helix-turn-helix protein [Orenia marismortui]